MNDFTGWSKGLTVTADGDAVISHAGAAALRLTADRSGLSTALSRLRRGLPRLPCAMLGGLLSG